MSNVKIYTIHTSHAAGSHDLKTVTSIKCRYLKKWNLLSKIDTLKYITLVPVSQLCLYSTVFSQQSSLTYNILTVIVITV